ncbi:MAG: hypothetical protein Q9210_007511 [Variospora velana]
MNPTEQRRGQRSEIPECTLHRQLMEADTDHLLAQDDVTLFLQDLDRFKTAPTAPFLPRRTPARPPTSRSSSTQSFKTAAEEPEKVPVAIDAAIRGSINDSSSQEEDDPIDEENFRLEVQGVILEDISSSEDDTTDEGEVSEDEDDEEDWGAPNADPAGEFVMI